MRAAARAVLEQRVAELEAEHERMRRELDGLLECLRITGAQESAVPAQAAPRHLRLVR